MQKLIAFTHVSLDGYFVDANGSMAWAKANQNDPEWNAFVAENARGEATLLLGRVTYELMSSYWPTPSAEQQDPGLAARMNALPKAVFSRTLDRTAWKNTKLVKGDLPAAVRKMKGESRDGMVILGSGTIVSQLTREGLIDEYQVVVNPIVLGSGRTVFDRVGKNLTLTKTRTFGNGNVFLCYAPAS